MSTIELPVPPVQDPVQVRVVVKERARFLRWLGRVTMWFVFLPVGIWLSIRHGRKISERRVLETINR